MSEQYLKQGCSVVQRLIESAQKSKEMHEEFGWPCDDLDKALEPFKDTVVFTSWCVDDLADFEDEIPELKTMRPHDKKEILEYTACKADVNKEDDREALKIVLQLKINGLL